MERFDRRIAALRDEVAAFNFEHNRGQNRLLSLVVAKLDEAQGLAVLAGIDSMGLVLIDRPEFVRKFAPEAVADSDDRTDRTENVSVHV